eukprot:TRINITY_DN17646_c0_g1_i1.p1 TRINITY_DN17646_c0_g1~~TRINITY_DN17646_c0_g1_i1.p1  ORF type:complete len:627 (-),score=87.90 TRINITY_DN17646_c0_g1_i1:149-2029(-)
MTDSDSDVGAHDEIFNAGSIRIQETRDGSETWTNPRDPDDQGKSPNTLVRSCTDLCMLPLVMCMAAASVFAIVDNIDTAFFMPEHQWQDVEDFTGVACGFGSNARKPYLFLCLLDTSLASPTSSTSSLDGEHPVCVEQCPAARNDSRDCVVSYDRITKITSWLRKPSYASVAILGRFCQPAILVSDNATQEFFADFVEFIEIDYPADVGAYLVFLCSRVNDNFWSTIQKELTVLASTAVFAVILSYAYAKLLAAFADCIVWSSVTFLVLSLFLAGGWSYSTADSGTRHSRLGLFLMLLSLIVVCWAQQLKKEINGATRCLMKASSCIADCPILKVVPLLSLTFKSAAAVHPIIVLAIVAKGILLNPTEEKRNEAMESLKMWYMYSLIPASVIGYNTFHAIFMYITAHAVGIWHFREEHTSSPYWVVLRYHLGSVALGGFVQMLLWPCKILFGIPFFVLKQLGCLQDLVRAYDEHVRNHSAAVWCDMSLQGYSYCKAARHVMHVRDATGSTGAMVGGATVAFQILGAVVVSYSSLLCSVVVEVLTGRDERDSTQALATIVAFWVSINIMFLLGDVSDSLIYYRRVDKLRCGEGEDVSMNICSPMHFLSMLTGHDRPSSHGTHLRSHA